MESHDGPEAEVARQAAAREEHARLVLERTGDPAYVQRRFTADGVRELSWDPESATGRELSALFEGLRESFREKFGRDPVPGDPVFFDPDAHGPAPLPPAAQDAWWQRLADAMETEGIDPAYALAGRDVGYMITPMNRHLYSAHQIEAYLDALQERWDQAAMDDVDLAPLEADVPRLLRAGLAALAAEPSPETAQAGIDTVFEAVEATGCSLAGFAQISARMLAVLCAWIDGARTRGADAGGTRAWLETHLAPTEATAVWDLWEALADPGRDLHDVETGPHVQLLAGLLLIAAALVAGPGHARPQWTTTFDPA